MPRIDWKKVNGDYVSLLQVHNINGQNYFDKLIRKREDGLWETRKFLPLQGVYIPFVSNLQTNEVRSGTGLYKTLSDAKTAFEMSEPVKPLRRKW